jgi:hypothetical protein
VRVVHGLADVLVQCPAKERGTGQHREALPARDKEATLRPCTERAVTRVRGAECAHGMVWALRDPACPAMRAPYSLPHFYTYRLTSYLVGGITIWLGARFPEIVFKIYAPRKVSEISEKYTTCCSNYNRKTTFPRNLATNIGRRTHRCSRSTGL